MTTRVISNFSGVTRVREKKMFNYKYIF